MALFKMNEEYFSGSQASIFIGDIWIDDVIDWQCSLGANATPIYGYGDTFYSHAAQGRVLVQGSFTINFKEPNYLFAAIARFNANNPANKQLSLTTQQSNLPNNVQELKYEDKRKSLDDFFYQKVDGTFTQRSDTVRSALMNSDIIGPVSRSISNSGDRFNSINDHKFSNNFAIPTFDIIIGYGAELNQDTVGEKIVGVKLIGKGKAIMANGEPIKETYNFFAMNIV